MTLELNLNLKKILLYDFCYKVFIYKYKFDQNLFNFVITIILILKCDTRLKQCAQ